MHAYVFWHAAPQHVSAAEYEKTLLRFTSKLAAANCPGVIGNASYAISETPWLNERGYEDWVWITGSWALDVLNERAVSGPLEAPHDAIAQLTKHGGFGALYYLVAGTQTIAGDSKVLWLTRPRGIKWRDVMPVIIESAHSDVSVWRRQMVLGPSPEFAVVGPSTLSVTLPDGWQALEVTRRRLPEVAAILE